MRALEIGVDHDLAPQRQPHRQVGGLQIFGIDDGIDDPAQALGRRSRRILVIQFADLPDHILIECLPIDLRQKRVLAREIVRQQAERDAGLRRDPLHLERRHAAFAEAADSGLHQVRPAFLRRLALEAGAFLPRLHSVVHFLIVRTYNKGEAWSRAKANEFSQEALFRLVAAAGGHRHPDRLEQGLAGPRPGRPL
jgi:hypothetical protein